MKYHVLQEEDMFEAKLRDIVRHIESATFLQLSNSDQVMASLLKTVVGGGKINDLTVEDLRIAAQHCDQIRDWILETNSEKIAWAIKIAYGARLPAE